MTHLDFRWRARLAVLLAALIAVFFGLGLRLAWLQWLQHSHWVEEAKKNTVVLEALPAPRGRMFDRAGRLVVSSRPTFDLYVIPRELKDPKEAAALLGSAAQIEAYKLAAKIDKGLTEAPVEELVLERSLNPKQLSRLAPVVDDLRGAYLGVRAERRYPHGKTAAHLVGTMGAISPEELRKLRDKGYSMRDMIGKTGLDQKYDLELHGRKGLRKLLVDAAGRALFQEEIRPPEPGHDLYLTLDLALQKHAERALGETLAQLHQINGRPSAGAAIVLGADTGKVLAMASLPQFDPAPFARGIRSKEYQALLEDPAHPLVSRAFQSSFSPGSTFKMITGMAALQENLTTPRSHFYCGGAYKGANCFVRSGHGGINFHNSLALSCDVVYYRLGDLLGIGRLSEYCRAIGLGSPTGLGLVGEDPGLVPTADWKEEYFGEPWYNGDTINSSIGQGFVLTSPLQMAVATATVANGGKVVQPYLVEKATTWKGSTVWKADPKPVRKLPVDPKFLSEIRVGMRGAVAHGTSVAADSPLAKVAGKTGTVESFPSPSNPDGKNHTWFVCFAPYEDPEIAIAVCLERSGGYGGSMAAPIARKILDYYFSIRKKS